MKPKFFDLARKLSYKSTHKKHRLGAVIVRKDKILGIGFNQLKTSPKANTAYNQIHAEIDALKDRYNKNFNGATIYVYRELQNGSLGLAKPCIYCQEALKKKGIKQCFYTSDTNLFGILQLA